MSKLDRELAAIIDDMGSQAKKIIPAVLKVMLDEDVEQEVREKKVVELIAELSPKTYDVYIADIKQVFREAGWKEPQE